MRELHHTVAVYVLDESDGNAPRALLLDHPHGAWFPPGGHIEVGETPHDAAVRELCEETSIPKSDVLWHVGGRPKMPGTPRGYIGYGEYPEPDGRVFQVHSFLARCLYGRPVVRSESINGKVTPFAWVSLRDPKSWPKLLPHVDYVLRHYLGVTWR